MAESWNIKLVRLTAPDRLADPVERAYRQHWADLCRYVRRKFGPGPPEPEEVAQTAFARFAALDNPRAVDNPLAFLTRCSHNIVLDYRRRDEVRERLSEDIRLVDPEAMAVNDDIWRVLSGRERLRIVEDVIRAMEPKRRKILIMHAIHGLSYAEIARRLNLSQTRVIQLAASAVALCEQALEDADRGARDDRGEAQK